MRRQVPETESPYAAYENFGVGDDPTIFSKLGNKTYRDSTAIVIRVNEAAKTDRIE